jgi:hypothetical protein
MPHRDVTAASRRKVRDLLQRARMMFRSCVLAVLAGISLVGCMDDKGAEEELPPDGKDDSFRKPTDHGLIEFGAPATSALTATERFHAWKFELSDTATVDLTTSYALRGQRRTDTVLYLYRETDGTWGPYIARNDDYGSTTYSRLVRELPPGRYRAIVKGHLESTVGKFKLSASCTGPGCEPGCVFGSTYHEAFTAPSLQKINSQVITAANLDTLSASLQNMLVRAVHESSHTDVTTASEALTRVDQEELNLTFFAEPAARRTFVAFEYGAGDNSYGAFFEKRSGERASAIHDGDLYTCTAQRETCLLPEDYGSMKSDPSFTRNAVRAVTSATQLSAAETAQAAIAMPIVYGQPTTVADGIAQADMGTINVATYTHVATGRAVTVLEWGAGDTSVGTMFHGATTNVAGIIDDLYIDGCTLFRD